MRLSAFGYLGSLAGLSHLRDSDSGHGAWGWMGVSLPRCEPVESKHLTVTPRQSESL